ncbi:hypothetical protein Btru_038673 [Bulinus truncatus]|nr:hypothetical protein Btru_038673 [Bulinus truncatus]
MSVIVYLQFTWSQPALAWNTTEFNDLDVVEIDTGSMWSPEVNAVIGTGDSLNLDLPNTLEVTHDGSVSARKQHQITFRCSIDFKKYPFDTQVCRLRFHVMTKKGLGMPTVLRSDSKINVALLYDVRGEWDVMNFALVGSATNSSGLSINATSATFTLKRRPVYYVITILFPLVMTSLMIPLVFLIPVNTGEKVSYLVAIFTSTAIFLNFICNVMPRSLSVVPYLAVFLIEVLAEGWLAMLTSLVVVRKFAREEQAHKHSKGNAVKLSAQSFKRAQVAPVEMVPPLVKGYHDYFVEDTPSPDQADGFYRPDSQVKGARCNVNSTLLDRVFFLTFTILQILFLIVIFCVVDWL